MPFDGPDTRRSAIAGVLLCAPAALLAAAAAAQAGSFQDSRAIFTQAQRALGEGNYKTAEKGFLAMLRIDPDSVAASTDLGVVYLRTGRFELAIRAFERAKRLAPQL